MSLTELFTKVISLNFNHRTLLLTDSLLWLFQTILNVAWRWWPSSVQSNNSSTREPTMGSNSSSHITYPASDLLLTEAIAPARGKKLKFKIIVATVVENLLLNLSQRFGSLPKCLNLFPNCANLLRKIIYFKGNRSPLQLRPPSSE